MAALTQGHKATRVRAIFELPAGELRTWMIVQLLDGKGTWTIKDVATFCGDNERTIHNYVVRLEKAGFVARVGRAETKPGHQGHAPHLFEITMASVEAPRIKQDGTVLPELQIQRLWRTMRMLKTFTVPELAGYAEAGEEPLNASSVKTYCAYLKQAGVLVDKGRVSHRGPSRMQLARPLGPRAPRILTANVVYDPNAKAVVGTARTREAVR